MEEIHQTLPPSEQPVINFQGSKTAAEVDWGGVLTVGWTEHAQNTHRISPPAQVSDTRTETGSGLLMVLLSILDL